MDVFLRAVMAIVALVFVLWIFVKVLNTYRVETFSKMTRRQGLLIVGAVCFVSIMTASIVFVKADVFFDYLTINF